MRGGCGHLSVARGRIPEIPLLLADFRGIQPQRWGRIPEISLLLADIIWYSGLQNASTVGVCLPRGKGEARDQTKKQNRHTR